MADVPYYPVHSHVAPASTSQGKVLVQLPDDASLRVDGREVPLVSGMRTIVTPELRPGQDYYYTLKAEAVRDGKVLSQERRVQVVAGKEVRVDFGDLASGAIERVVAAPARVTVHLPATARLYINGEACPLQSEVRAINTPKLAAGKVYTYALRAELDRNGQRLTADRRVTLTAGKQVQVRFDDMQTIRTASR